MNTSMNVFPFGQKMLGRWGSRYILLAQIGVQLISFAAASGGILYILLNVEFTPQQVRALFLGVGALVIFVNIILMPVMHFASSNARRRLKLFGLGFTGAVDAQLEFKAWREITSFPWRFGWSASVAALFAVILPITLIMYYAARVTFDDAVHVAIGGTLSATILIALDVLLLEYALTPARLALLPSGYNEQAQGLSGSKLQTRVMVIVSAVTVITLLTIAPRSYQEAVNALAAMPGDHRQAIRDLQTQMAATAIAAIFANVAFAFLLARSVYHPIQAMLSAIHQAEEGKRNVRSDVLGTDETGALAIQFNRMIARIEILQTSLEGQVAERTAQLSAVNEVGRTISAILDPEELIEKVVNLITDRFGHYYAAIFLLDSTEKWAELKSATGEAGRVLRQSRHRLGVDNRSMVGSAVSQREARIALDVGAESVRFNNPLLPYTRSEIALPLMAGERVLGALDIQSTREAAFAQADIETFQNVANQVAIALENARLFQETNARLQELQAAQRQYVREAWDSRAAQEQLEYGVGDVGGEGESATLLQIPLALRDEVIGQIRLEGSEEWSPEERAWIESVATQAAIALENARLMEASREQASLERTVAEITTKVWSASTVDGILQTAVKEIGRALNLSETRIELGMEEKEEEKRD